MKLPVFIRRYLLIGSLSLFAGIAPAFANTEQTPVTLDQFSAQIDTAKVQAVVNALVTDQRTLFAHSILAGVGARGRLGEAWKPGNEFYEQEFQLASASVSTEEERGPILSVTPDQIKDAMTALDSTGDAAVASIPPEDLTTYARLTEYAIVAKLYQYMTKKPSGTPEVANMIDQQFALMFPDQEQPSKQLATLTQRDPGAGTKVLSVTSRVGQSVLEAVARSVGRRLSIAFFRINGDLSQVTAQYRDQMGLLQ